VAGEDLIDNIGGMDLPIQMRVIEFESYVTDWYPELSRKKYTALEKVVFHRKPMTEYFDRFGMCAEEVQQARTCLDKEHYAAVAVLQSEGVIVHEI